MEIPKPPILPNAENTTVKVLLSAGPLLLEATEVKDHLNIIQELTCSLNKCKRPGGAPENVHHLPFLRFLSDI